MSEFLTENKPSPAASAGRLTVVVTKRDRSTPLSRFVQKRFNALPHKSMRQVSANMGFTALNMVSMIASGESKLPLDRVPSMARELECDPAVLLRLALAQFMGGSSLEAVNEIMGTVVSKNEAEIVEYIREITNESDPELDDALRGKLQKTFK